MIQMDRNHLWETRVLCSGHVLSTNMDGEVFNFTWGAALFSIFVLQETVLLQKDNLFHNSINMQHDCLTVFCCSQM